MKPRLSHALTLLLLAPAAPALAEAQACAGFPAGASTHVCSCAPGPHGGAVWGSGPYTADSDICAAALHAGVIGPEGGQVIAMSVTPPASFAGTQANGVTTSDWGAFDRAFVLHGARLAEGVDSALPLCGTLGEAAQLTCRCPADAPLGSVWGSGPYTADSDICTAALHAGRIGPEGGEVTARRVGGQQSYRGSTANGVTTSDWGSYGASLAFGSKG